MTKTGPGLTSGIDGKRLSWRKTSPRSRGRPQVPADQAAAGSSARAATAPTKARQACATPELVKRRSRVPGGQVPGGEADSTSQTVRPRPIAPRRRLARRGAEDAALPAPTPAAGARRANRRRGRLSASAPDVEALAHNIAQAIEQGGKALAAYLRPRESGEIKTTIADDIGEMVRSIGRVAEYYMSDPERALSGAGGADQAVRRPLGFDAAAPPGRAGAARSPRPTPRDKRFADPAWRDNPYFDFIKQAYVLTTRWADDLVKRADELDPHDARQGAILSAPGDRRAVALELPRHQSGAAAHDARRERREPGARPENAGRGHRGRPRQPAHSPVRRDARSSSASISRRRPAR